MAEHIALLDYGMGNLRSVEKALIKVGADVVVTADRSEITTARGIVLPGVGAFPRAMARIRELGWDGLIPELAESGTPVLGICLGYQLLFEHSEEFGGSEGLAILPGRVRRLDAPGLRIPHIGWEPVEWVRPWSLAEGIESETAFYFVHSFTPIPDESNLVGTAMFGEPFAACVSRGNVHGVQFHPEKSSGAGLRLLENFVDSCAQ